MHRQMLLKRIMLLFWASYFTIVVATNLCDAAKAAGILDESPFASGNFRFVCETTARYGTPMWVNAVLFAGVLLWEVAAAASFWWAAVTFRGSGNRSVYVAFTIGLGLWAAFIIADEVFIAYPVEATHFRLFTAQLATLLVIELIREE